MTFSVTKSLRIFSNSSWVDVPISRAKRAPYKDYRTPEEKLKDSVREYLRQYSPEELQKVINDLVTENVIEA